MTKRQTRLLVIMIVLVLLLLTLGGYFYYYKTTKTLSFKLTGAAANTVVPPQFLFAFSGSGQGRLVGPLGILVDGQEVYVADAARSLIHVYDPEGKWQRSMGASITVRPLYIAKNPKDGLLYVSDRSKRGVLKFTTDGKYKGAFDPRLPKNQLPKFDTKGTQWTPLAIAFAPDGTMFVTETLNGHRFLIFGPDGKFKKSVGDAGAVSKAQDAPTFFQFPNGLMVFKNELYVADSNNRRVVVFGLNGDFKRVLDTQGLPRGLTSLEQFTTDTKGAESRIVVVDTLSHDGTIFTSTGEKIVNFGEQGRLRAQFSYPNSVSRGAKNRLYITDTSNARVQVWGWPEQAATVPVVGAPRNVLLYCGLPLLLLPLLLLTRKRRYYATADFVQEMAVLDQLDLLDQRRVRWITTQEQYDVIAALLGEESDITRLFEVQEYSDSDARALRDKYEIGELASIILSVGQRARLFCTQDPDLRRVATLMELDNVDAVEYVKTHSKRKAKSDSDASKPGPVA